MTEMAALTFVRLSVHTSAAGFDESSIRAVIDGVLRVRYREQVAAWRIDGFRTAWWNSWAA